MPYLRYKEGASFRYFQLPEDRMAIFGRETHCDFQLTMDPEISREHFGVQRDESGHFVLIDLGATNGTFLNDRRLDNDIIPLSDKDRIRAGSQFFVYFENKPGVTPGVLFNEVADSINKGKGFKTVMLEIIGDK